MGSGKTTWAINYINKNKSENILYITPFLDEIERIKAKCLTRNIVSPEPRGKSKLDNLNELLASQLDIASTHALFKKINNTTKKYIEEGKYVLILDEVLEVVRPFNGIKSDDLKILQESGCISVDKDNFIIWNNGHEYDSRYNDMKSLAENKCLILIDNKLFLWQYPPEIFNLFSRVYVLTYLFEASILKGYFDLYHIKYEKKSINKNFQLCDYYKPDTHKFENLINIYSGNLNNNIGEKNTMLSSSWFSRSYNKDKIKQLKNNCVNYFNNILNTSSDTIMWTTYEKVKNDIKGKGYTNGFVPCNCRATNEYQDKYNLAYILNLYPNPEIKKFFEQRGIIIDEDLYSLSEFIQWIWRSRIRQNEAVNIYVPSNRMRSLLKEWIK